MPLPELSAVSCRSSGVDRPPTLVTMGSVSQTSLTAAAGAIWDLRDHSYDHPEQWTGVYAESIFQAMAEIIERAIDAGEDVDWTRFPVLDQATLVGGGPKA
jgi:flavin-binding protein dodecin